MKRSIYKFLCALMAVCVVLSAIPFSAFADNASGTTAGTVTNGSYTDGVWSAGGNGSVTYDVNGTDVTLSKTATPVAGMDNTFDITLSVRTSTTSVSHTSAAAVVLVIDTSGSMAWCSECGNERTHDRDCTYYQEQSGGPGGPGNRVDNSVTYAQTRMAATKGAAISFLQNYAGTDATADRHLAIVQFADNYSTKLSWVNVAGGAGKNSYDAAVSTINGLYADGGTNLEGGLYTAGNLLNSVSDYGTKGVVLLTDGAPTKSMTAGNGMSGNKAYNDAAEKRAKEIKNKGASLYTICFGAADDITYTGWPSNGPTVGNFLSSSIASSGCAYNASNADDVYAAFRAISENITSGLSGSGWTATDPMADMISVSSAPANITTADGHTYTWTLDNAQTETVGSVTTYVYTTTYRVTLDVQGQNFEEGKFFPTNEETYLNIDGEQYAFPVPGVTGKLPRTSVTVSKQWEDANDQDGIRPDSVTVQLMEGNTTIGNPVTLNASNGWSHTWTDLIEKSKGVYHTYSVVEVNVPEGYTATYPTNDNNRFALTVVNTHTVAKKNVTVNKVWADGENQDGIRPASITVRLLANGMQVATAELNAANNWSHTFTGLDENSNGSAVTYTVEEVNVPDGYTASVNGLTVTNTHTPDTTEIPVTKVWVDNNDQDGKRPGSITVKLMANGEETGKTLVLSAANNWSGSFTDLDVFANGNPIMYYVQEVEVAGYTSVYSGNTVSGIVITNTHTPEVISVSGSKTWVDNNNQDGARPTSITIHLLKNGQTVDSKTVTANDNWSWTFENLPKYENGQEIVYSISEDTVTDYSTTYNGYNVTNTHTPAKTSVTVSKAWVDNNNQDGIRPNDITVKLMANGEETGKTLVLSAANNWTGSFTDLDVFENGNPIMYYVQEVEVAGYTSVYSGDTVSGIVITNTHTPEVISVSGSKTWVDNNNQDGARPTSITINLVKDGRVVDTKTVTANDNWSWMFENLPKKENGQDIVYTITENAVPDYTTTYNGYNVTNTHAPAKTSVTVSKAWVDNNNQDGIRPNDITVKLMANGQNTGKTLVLSSGNNWTGSFTDLDKFENGTPISYTVSEVNVEGYTSVITGTMAEGYTITNTHSPEVVSISGSKTWVDNNNQDGARPGFITINLVKDGRVVDTKTVTANDNWSWTFENLPKKENGQDIVYTITEDAVSDYTTTYNGYNVTNTHTPAKVSITVIKAWVDSNNQDGIRPNDITVKLMANGQDTGKTLVLSSGNNWTGSFTDLDKFENGTAISYTVDEVSVEGYASVITGTMAEGFTITNSHTPETVTISGSKKWNDKNNQDGKRPGEIVIHLNANGNSVATKTVTASDGWKWSFENMPKYENGGSEIQYSITEETVDGYSTTYDGYDVTNAYTPQQTSITVAKSWQDNNDQDGIRPEKIIVNLLANGEVTGKTLALTADNNWTDSFTKLDVYADSEEIVYTIEEVEIEGYSTVITGTSAEGFTITNSHTPETVTISGTKTWNDNNNQDGKRPGEITIHLNANGVSVATKTVTAEDGWAWSFEGMAKYENGGKEIVYTITEDAVDGYSATYDGFNVTNSYTPEKINISVKKVWVDSNNGEKIRPDSVTVHLFANGQDTGLSMTLSDENNWIGSFENLPKMAGGEAIHYEITEDSVKGYNAVITGTAADGFAVTNSHNYIPKTGDERTPVLWISLMGISFLVMAVAGVSLFTGKKKTHRK